MSGHQPKELTELAFASFTAYMKDQALQFLNWMKVLLPCAEIETKASGTCRELKDFFHGTRLTSVLANEITKRLLTMLGIFSEIYKSTRKVCFQQNFLPLVEVFMHPDVTSIELGPGNLQEFGYEYYNFIVTMILVKVNRLHNLKTLSVERGIRTYLKGVKLVLPAQLKELTLWACLCSDHLKSIAGCCRELKSLKIAVSDVSVPHLLKLNRLETLHLLGGVGYGLDEECVALINGISTDVSSDVLCASTLKSFGIFLREESSLRLIVDKLPHLAEIVLCVPCEFDLSCLSQLKNLRSLTLDAPSGTSDEHKKILPVLGKSLVSLDLRGYRSLDLELIGETCSNLRCLHICIAGDVKACLKPSLKDLPNFRTVKYLKVCLPWDLNWIEFLIAQCVNIKVLSILFCDQATIIENVLNRTSLINLEEIHLFPASRTHNSFLELLFNRCPNLRLVHGLGSDSFVSERVVFNLRGCHKCYCETRYNIVGILEE